MAITIYQAQDALQLPMFLKRVEYALVVAAIAISNEASGSVNHAARVTLAKAVVNSPGGYTTKFAQGIVSQLQLSTTNLLSNPPDLDTTDAALATSISAIFNTYT